MLFRSSVITAHPDEHMVMPKLVYISNSTEIGTVYTKAELCALRECCDENGLYLYMDGARLATALVSDGADCTLADIAKYCDAFYIGGTKNGALMGEALVITNKILQKDFRYMMKQNGALTAKSWLMGMQFEVLFEGGLYFSLAENANKMAGQIKTAFTEQGYKLFTHSVTNQVFVILPKTVSSELSKTFIFEDWENIDDENKVVRFVCSWATPQTNIDKLVETIKNLKK